MKLKDGVKILYGTTDAYKGSPLTLQRGDGTLAVFNYNSQNNSTPAYVWGGSGSEYKLYNPAYFTVDKAAKDGDGNTISSTYLKLTGGTITGNLTVTNNLTVGNKIIYPKKTYTNVYATKNNAALGNLYFAKLVPDSYTYKEWHVKYKIHAYATTQSSTTASYKGNFIVDFWGGTGKETIYSFYNAHYDLTKRTLYSHVLLSPSSSTYPYCLGVGLQSAANCTDSTYARTFEIELLEADNCTVTFLGSMSTISNLSYSTSTHSSPWNPEGWNNGLRESGDDNDTTTVTNAHTRYIAGSGGIMQLSIVMQDSSGTWQSFTTTSGYNTGKTKNTAGFRLGKMFYFSGTSNVTSGNKAGASTIHSYYTPINIRYSTNSEKNLSHYKPFYIVGTLSNGLFYLDDTWWTQTEPTSADNKIYIYVGTIYNDDSDGEGYRLSFLGWQGAYVYRNGVFQEYVPFSENASLLDGVALSRFPYATHVGAGTGTSEETGTSSDLTRTLFWRDNSRSSIGMFVSHSLSSTYGWELSKGYFSNRFYTRVKSNGTWSDSALLAFVSDIPTKVSELTNDSGYITKDVSDLTNYVKKAGDTMTGALNFANGTWNLVGDDCYMGDYNAAGLVGFKGNNGNTGLGFVPYTSSWSTVTFKMTANNVMTLSSALSVGSNLTVSGNYNGMMSLTSNTLAASGQRTSTSTKSTVLRLWGTTYGNTATDRIAEGKYLSYGDAGPQILFSTTASDASGTQSGALIFTDHDTIGSGVSLSFVTNQSTGYFVAPHFKTPTGTSSQFLKADGSVDSNTYLTSHQSLANYVTLDGTLTITGKKTFSSLIVSTVATNTAPFSVASTTLVSNLNADLLDGLHATSFSRRYVGVYGRYNKFLQFTRSIEKGWLLVEIFVSSNGGSGEGGKYIISWGLDSSNTNKAIDITSLYTRSDKTTAVTAVRNTGNTFDLYFDAGELAGYFSYSVLNYSSSCTINSYEVTNVSSLPTATYTSTKGTIYINISGNASTATSAAKLTTVSKTAWGQTYWTSGGVPTSISGDMSDVGTITMTGGIKMANLQILLAKNSSGSYEAVFWPRWNDNATYLNYGAGGFYIRNNSYTATVYMNASNNVGIGTTSPTQKLHVNGSTLTTGTEYIGGDVVIASTVTLHYDSTNKCLNFNFS